jgi:hypothetical protein
MTTYIGRISDYFSPVWGNNNVPLDYSDGGFLHPDTNYGEIGSYKITVICEEDGAVYYERCQVASDGTEHTIFEYQVVGEVLPRIKISIDKFEKEVITGRLILVKV